MAALAAMLGVILLGMAGLGQAHAHPAATTAAVTAPATIAAPADSAGTCLGETGAKAAGSCCMMANGHACCILPAMGALAVPLPPQTWSPTAAPALAGIVPALVPRPPPAPIA